MFPPHALLHFTVKFFRPLAANVESALDFALEALGQFTTIFGPVTIVLNVPRNSTHKEFKNGKKMKNNVVCACVNVRKYLKFRCISSEVKSNLVQLTCVQMPVGPPLFLCRRRRRRGRPGKR